MTTKHELERADVKAVAAAAEAEAIKNQWAVTIAIVDDGGHLLWLQRLDGAAAVSSHIAPSKACTAAMGRSKSKVYEDNRQWRPHGLLERPRHRRPARRRRTDPEGWPVHWCCGRELCEIHRGCPDRTGWHCGFGPLIAGCGGALLTDCMPWVLYFQ